MDDKRNIALAVLLTALILFGWPLLMDKFFPSPEAASEDVAVATEAAPPANPEVVTEATPARTRDLNEALQEGGRVRIRTPKMKGSIDLVGARIDDVTLNNYDVGMDSDAPVRLFAPAGTPDAYFARFGWVGQGLDAPGEDTRWTADGDALTPETPVTLRWDNGGGQTFEIALSVDENYMITADQTVLNRGSGPVALNPFGLISRTGESSDSDSWIIHVGPMGVFDGEADYDWDYDDVADEGADGVAFESTGGWLGFTDKYWLSALIPDQSASIDAKFRSGGGIYQTQMVRSAPTILEPGQKITHGSRLFVGAKETQLLDGYESDLGIANFDKAIDWGWFAVIEKPIFYILHWLYEMAGNFGVAIIILTIGVRVLLFPIAQKQFASMAHMRAVQPKMKKIQERYKDDKQKQQQEIMKLYKEEKVNPLAGCMPLILQIPIFFALYKVLMLSIEMRHKPFALWIDDLSAPDPLTPVNLFGLLPFDPPGFLAIGVLPILLGITMWLQFRLNPQPMDDMQKQIFGIMPWILMFVMAPFAAGLQLYWVTTNLLTIAQQKWLYSRHPQLKEQMARDAEEKAKEKERKEAEAKAES